MTSLLTLENVDTYYGAIHILKEVSLHVNEGEIVCLLGGNACGKSTTLKTALGMVSPKVGKVTFAGEDVTKKATSARVKMGIAVVPENRRLFGPMTVLENLKIGAFVRGEADPTDLERIFELFPKLRERQNQLAGTLSGGEQQMVAVGRALMSKPRLILMDEPSMGLSPRLVEQSFEMISLLNKTGVSILMVEQNANMALSIADRGYVLQTGVIVLEGSASELAGHEELRRAYLGR
jgi:branched-chain amino acid transport system ATP-binding protein